jgi:hypothetical protein
MVEIRQAGSGEWQIGRPGFKMTNDKSKQIKGYASATSVNKGRSSVATGTNGASSASDGVTPEADQSGIWQFMLWLVGAGCWRARGAQRKTPSRPSSSTRRLVRSV